MFVNVLRAQQTKTLASGILWIELAALAAITALLVTLTNTITELKADAPVTMAGQMNEMLQHAGTSTMGHVLAVVLAGAIMANEYNWRSLHLWLSQGVSRTTLLWTKFVSLIVPVALFFVVTAAVTAAIAGGFVYAEHGSIGPVAGELDDLLRTGRVGSVRRASFRRACPTAGGLRPLDAGRGWGRAGPHHAGRDALRANSGHDRRARPGGGGLSPRFPGAGSVGDGNRGLPASRAWSRRDRYRHVYRVVHGGGDAHLPETGSARLSACRGAVTLAAPTL